MITIQSMGDVRALLRDLPEPDNGAAARAARREATLTKPAGSLGRLEELVRHVCAWQGRHPPTMNRCGVAIFAGNHGVADEDVSAFPADVTGQMVGNFSRGGAAINQLSAISGAKLKIFPIELDSPTHNFRREAAMSEDGCARAMEIGASAVEDGLDILCLGEMGIANTTAAAALCHGIFGGDAESWVGPGTGVQDAALANKIRVVRDAVALHDLQSGDGLDALRRVGGREIAAIAGAILAARFARVPVILDGFVCCAAAACLCIGACWTNSASSRCSTSGCGWAKARGRLWRSWSSGRRSRAIPAWRPSMRQAFRTRRRIDQGI
jgi:nicotinate-nucleotide--dimethylbenzimidazole phosphoribosyltransferase